MKTSVTIILVGLLLFSYATSLPAYKDEQLYMQKYLLLEGTDRNERFYELRKEQLTNKFEFQNYGLTITMFGLILFPVLRRGWSNVSAPRTQLRVAVLGIVAALSTVAVTVGSLFLEYERGEFPHWADSLAIPLMGMPVLLVLLICWASLVHFAMRSAFVPGACLAKVRFRGMNIMLAISLGITAIILILSAITGDFWYIVPSSIWLYFYLSLMAGRTERVSNTSLHPTPQTARRR